MRYSTLAFTLIIFLQSCSQSEIDSLKNEVYNLENEVSDIEYEMSELQDVYDNLTSTMYEIELAGDELEWQIQNLRSEIDEFSWQDWETNVWDVDNQMYQVESALSDLQYQFN